MGMFMVLGTLHLAHGYVRILCGRTMLDSQSPFGEGSCGSDVTSYGFQGWCQVLADTLRGGCLLS